MPRRGDATPTLQSLLRRRQSDTFVGRKNELETFSANLEHAPEDRSWLILNVFGQGGLGKTTLLRRFEQAAKAEGAVTGWSDHADADLVQVMRSLNQTLGGTGRDFSQLLSEYERSRYEIESDPDAPEAVARLIGSAIGRGGIRLARHIPGAGLAFELADEATVGEGMAEAAAFVARRLSRDQAELVQEPLPRLTAALIRDLDKLAPDHPAILLFFDTYERTGTFLESWLLALLGGALGQLPGSTLVIVAGRNQLDPNQWAAYEPALQRIELAPMAPTDAEELLRRRGVTDPSVVGEIERLSQGLPLLLTTLASNAHGARETLEATTTAVERFLSWEADPQRRRTILEAAVPRVFSEDTLALLFGPERQSLFTWLVELPFVQSAPEGWEYHPVVRLQMLSQLRRQSYERWYELNDKLASHYRDLAARTQSRWEDRAWRTLDSNETYHLLLADYAVSLGLALRRVIVAWSVGQDVAREAVAALQQAEEDLQIPPIERWGDRADVAIARAARNVPDAALAFLTAVAEHQAEAPNGFKALLLVERAELWVYDGDPAAALADLTSAHALTPDDPRILYQRAAVHERLDEHDLALADLTAARSLIKADSWLSPATAIAEARVVMARDGASAALPLLNTLVDEHSHPWAFLTRGQILSEMREIDPAVADLERAIELAPRYEHEGAKEIGIALLRKGDETGAEQAIKRALRDEPRCVDCWSRLANIYVERGLEPGGVVDTLRSALDDELEPDIAIYRALALRSVGLVAESLEEFDRGAPDAPDARYYATRGELQLALQRGHEAAEDASKALELRPRYAPALVVRAFARRQIDDLAGAIDDLGRAFELNATYRTPDNLNYRGVWLARAGRLDEAIAMYEHARELNKAVDWINSYNIAAAKTLRDGAEAASSEIERAISEAPDEGPFENYVRAGLKAASGDADAALKQLAEVVRNDRNLAEEAQLDPAWAELRDKSEFTSLFEK